MSRVRFLPTILAKWMVHLAFSLCKLVFRIDQKKITFASYREEELTGNLAFVYEEFKSQGQDFKYSFLFKKLNTTVFGKFDYFLHMVKASYHLATSRFFIIDDYYFPVYAISPREGTDIVQLWHAAGAFKKFGLSTINKSFGPSEEYLKHIKVHSNYSKAIVSSTEVVPFYAEAFGMPRSRIIPLGVPRTDYFFKTAVHQELRERFYKTFPKLKEKKLILYAPTFRGKSHYQDGFDLPIDIKTMYDNLGSEYALVIHLHPYMQGDVNIPEAAKEFVWHIHNGFDIQELLVLSDLLITDYSSVIFDYSLLCRPIAFIATDLEEYKQERDFYFPFESFIPGPFFTDTVELANWIRDGQFDDEKVVAFRNRFFDFHDGRSSYRIVKHLIGNTK